MWDRSVEMHAQHLLDCPSPALLPVLLLLMALELGNVLLKAWTCRADAMSYRRLTARRFEVSKEIKSLGIPTDFVRKSKLERELIQVEKDLAPLKAQLSEHSVRWDKTSKMVKYAAYAALVLAFWSRPLLTLSPSATWPMAAVFSFPGFPPGAVSVWGCIVAVQGVASMLAPHIV